MTVETFLDGFEKETIDLTVRIFWVMKDRKPEMLGNYYHCQARFDQAVDPITHQKLDLRMMNWLHWLNKKSLFSDPYGYHFKTGRCYTLRLRRAREEGEKFTSWLIEKLIEADVREPLLDPVMQFEGQYAQEEVEKTVLVKEISRGWAIHFEYRTVSIPIAAWADENGITVKSGYLTKIEKNTGADPYRSFKDYGIYKVLVRPHLEYDSRFMLVKNLGAAENAQLAEICEEYRKPVIVENELGTFELNRKYNWFEGTVDWLGSQVSVNLEVEEDSTDCQKEMEVLRRLCSDLPASDTRVREFIAEDMMELLGEWYDEPLTAEEFMERIGTPAISVSTDGSVQYWFDSGPLFADHSIVAYMEPDGTFSGTNLEG